MGAIMWSTEPKSNPNRVITGFCNSEWRGVRLNGSEQLRRVPVQIGSEPTAMRIRSIVIFMGLGGFLFVVTAQIPAPHSPTLADPCLKLQMQVTDFRGLYAGEGGLGRRIAAKECLVDVRGLVTTRTGIPPQSGPIAWSTNLTVGAVLDKLDIEIGDFRGSQLRIFKRNEIIQTSRFYAWKNPSEATRIKAVMLDPGDVIFFTAVE
jgi:hypothetical protein